MIGFYFLGYVGSICRIIIHWWKVLGLSTVHGRRSLLHLHLLLQEILRRRLRLSITLGALGHPRNRLLVIRILWQGNPGRFLQLQIWAIGIKLLLLRWRWSILLPLLPRTLSLFTSGCSRCPGTGCGHRLAPLARRFMLLGLQDALNASCLDFAAYLIPGALFYALSSGLIHLFQFFKILVLSGWFILEFWLLNWCPLACIIVHRRHDLRHWHKLLSIAPLTFLQSRKVLASKFGLVVSICCKLLLVILIVLRIYY